MGMLEKTTVMVAIACVILSVHLFVYPLDGFLLPLFMERAECPPGDVECLNRVNSLRDNCTLSESVVTIGNGTNNITIRSTTYRDGEDCVTREEVIEDSSGITFYDLTGYNITCNISQALFEKYGHKACNGSLISFLLSSEEPEDDGGGDEPAGEDYVYRAYCSLEAEDCKEEAADYIKNCRLADILMDMEIDHTQGGTSYWTLSIQIDILPVEYTSTKKLQERCSIYHELVNAVNLPPEIPPSTIGDTMTCTIETSEFPISNVPISSCEGPLVEYIKAIYP